jgi:hypothetical protein
MFADPTDKWPERMEAIGHGTFIDGKPWSQLRAQLMAQPDLLDSVAQSYRRAPCGAAADGECIA